MVFVQQGDRAEDIAARLEHHKVPAVSLHAAGDKFSRKQAMDDFRSGRIRVMVASDMAARGLDIPGVTHVFNLDVPTQSMAYLHRVGRGARAGAGGQAVTLATPEELRRIRRFEEELGIVLHSLRLREGRMIPEADAPQRR